MHPDRTTDYDIQALVDGQLSRQEEKRVLNQIKGDSTLRARYDSLRRQKEMLRLWWASEIYRQNGAGSLDS